MESNGNTIYTIGYGALKNHAELEEIMNKHGITRLIDIRSKPFSRRNLAASLNGASWNKQDLAAHFGERYIHMVELGGLGFEPEDYPRWMETANRRILELIMLSKEHGHKLLLMCAEKSPRNCHRAYLAGRALEERGYKIIHL